MDTKKVTVNTSGADDVVEQIGDITALEVNLTPAEDRRILRKIDFCLLPVLFISYSLQFLDKQAMSYGAILGLQKDLHLVGQEYSWAGSIFYFGFLGASYPVSYLMVRMPLGRFLAGSMIIWSIVLLCMASVHNARGLQAARFFLGFAEAAISPGFSLVTATWYKRSEQPTRHAIWYIGNLFSGFFGSLIFYGLGHVHGMAQWKIGFLLFGGFTFLWSLACWVLIPNTPLTAWFLSQEDRIKAIERVKHNQTGIKNNNFKMYQFWQSMQDPINWLLFFMHVAGAIPNGGITTFQSIIIKGMGFTTLHTLLVQMISNAFTLTFVIITTIGVRQFHNTRTLWLAGVYCVSILGGCLVYKLPSDNTWGRYMSLCVMMAFGSAFPIMMALAASNIAGFTRKTTVNALSFVGYCVGNIIGPQIFFSRQAPTYSSGFIGMVCCWAALVLMCLALRFYMMSENRKRDRLQAEVGVDMSEVDDGIMNLLDKTDKENLAFRYIY